MTREEKQLQHEETILEIQAQNQIRSMLGEQNRAISYSIGNCYGGMIDITMRGSDGKVLFVPIPPVEAVELLHQIAGAIGVTAVLKPRNDFASWRTWKVTQEGQNGFPPETDNVDEKFYVGIEKEKITKFIERNNIENELKNDLIKDLESRKVTLEAITDKE